MADNAENVQGILQDSLASVGLGIRREGSSLSVSSLPATMMTPKPFFKSKIPTPSKNGTGAGSSGRSTPVHHRSKSDLLRNNLSSPQPPMIPPKPKLGAGKPILRREISSPPSLNERRGSIDAPLKFKSVSKIPQWKGSSEKISTTASWKGSTEKLNATVRGQIRKWESSASLELHNLAESERGTKSKTRQNLELSAKNKELTQSLKQLHQSFLASNQVDPANIEGLKSRLEQKDKEICALKQAAKERERKMEKMHLMLKKHRPHQKKASSSASKEETKEDSHSMSNSTYMDLLTENATLHQKIGLLEKSSNNEENNPWLQKEISQREAKIEDLTKALEDRMSEVQLIEEKSSLQTLNESLVEKLQKQQEELHQTQSQLKDARDQADLLEFRVLELEEENEKMGSNNTKPDDLDSPSADQDHHSLWSDSGCNSSVISEMEPSPSELILEPQDFKNEKVADTKTRLQKLMMSTPGTADKSLLVQTVALFEALLGKINQLQDENQGLKNNTVSIDDQMHLDREKYDQIVLELEAKRHELEATKETIVTLTNSRLVDQEQLASLSLEIEKSESRSSKHSKFEDVLQKQISELQTKLESAHQGREAESEMAQEALKKTSQLERSITELTAKLKGLMDENADLKEQLYEHQTTKSCDSHKVPSELSEHSEHRDSTKGSSSSGVSSDLSDSDHEIDDHSKVFDFHIEASTQTALDEEKKNELNKLTQEIEKLSKFKSVIEAQRSPSSVHHSHQDSSFNGGELDDLRIECKQLVTRKHSLESELEDYKGEISTLRRKLEEGGFESDQKMTALGRVEYSLRNQLKEWEKKYNHLKSEHQGLLEEKCELEEAENDSRLNAQRWEHQHKSTVEKSELLSDELTMERKSNCILRSELDTVQANLEDARNEASYYESLIQRYEQRVFDLEELEVELREKLSLLEGAVQFAIWWNATLMNQGFRCPDRPMLVDYTSDINPQASFVIQNQAENRMITNDHQSDEDWPTLVNTLKSEKLKLTQSLNALLNEKESLALSLENNHENKIERIVHLEDKVTELLNAAQQRKEEYTKEIGDLRRKLSAFEKQQSNSVDLQAPSVSSSEQEKIMQQSREDAYRQTIAEADSMLSKLEADYQSTIKSLQEEKASLEDQVRLLEQSQGYLKNQLAKLVNDTEKREELADLSERLLATERRELDLKEKVHTLQMAEQELNLALQEQRKINEELKEDLKDQDEILLHNSQIKQENQKLLADLGRLRESESFLSGRVDELELEASNLKADLCLSDKKIWDRERKWVEKVDILQDQLAFSSEDSLSKHSLKIEVEGLKNQTADLKQNLEEKSIELEKCETAFRAEVAKLRNQLTLSNNQLTECDRLNGKLREELEQAKELIQNQLMNLERAKLKEEQTEEQFNQTLAEKDYQILDLQDKLDGLIQPRMNSARSREELEAIESQEGGLVVVTKQLKTIALLIMECSNCQNEQGQDLKDAISELESLSQIMCSGSQNPSFKKFSSLKRLDLLRCESEELLSKSTMALNYINQCGNQNNSIEEEEDNLDLDDDDKSSYHSSSSQNDFDSAAGDNHAILAKSLEALQSKLHRMEQELVIVGEESKELQESLGLREDDLKKKDKEIRELAGVVEHMRQLNIRTVESLEKQKLRTNSIIQRFEQTQGLLSQWQDKCAGKDLLIKTVLDVMQNTIEFSVSTFVRSLRETTVKPSFVKKGGIDFNLEILCQYLENSANEMVRQIEEEKQQQKSSEITSETPIPNLKKINPTLMPPKNFRITRRVGSDSLLVAWSPPNDVDVSGYLIYVNGQLHQKVRSASRTKALLHALNLKMNFELSIHSIGCHGTTISTLEIVHYLREMVLKPPLMPMQQQK